jgi:nucleotide-binding universal stress UspA family protein
MDIKTILVPLDFSECSHKALRVAGELAMSFGAQIDVLHVWEVPPYIPPEAMIGVPGTATQSLTQMAHGHAREQLDSFLAESRALPLRQTLLDSGDPARVIVETAERLGSDMIAIGTHGRTGLSHLLLGSVAEKVVRRAPCPVLTVRVPVAQS